MRVDRVTWAEQDERIVIVDVPEEFTDIETELLYIQVSLHNACEKLAWMRRTHPALDPSLPEDLVEAVQQLIPSFRNPLMAATDVLWANRCFRIPLEPGQPSERVLIPVIDMLNHDAAGATADWTGEEFQVATHKPFGTTECALNYGSERNALEMAVVYGFAPETAAAMAMTDSIRKAAAEIIRLATDTPDRESSAVLARAAQLIGSQT
jgi:hypothetical protein